jgi:hypothetical protein
LDRTEPEESTESPLDWKLKSEVPDVLLGYKESKIGYCGGVVPSRTKETAQRAGAGNVEAPALITTERIKRTLLGDARDECT